MYRHAELLGEGVHGKVYRAKNSKSGEWVALKMMVLKFGEDGIPATTVREVAILRSLDSPYVVSFKDVHISHSGGLDQPGSEMRVWLIFEYVDYDLTKYVDEHREKRGGLSLSDSKNICRQILLGVKYCHDNSTMHRDLKPQNILVTADGQVKLADFGLGRVFTSPEGNYTDEIVTLWYRSPELLLGAKNYSPAVDVWSVGCILAELALGLPLFDGETEIEQLLLIFRKRGTPTLKSWPNVQYNRHWHEFPTWAARPMREEFPSLDTLCADLLDKMLTLCPQERISAGEALEHPFFKDAPAEKT